MKSGICLTHEEVAFNTLLIPQHLLINFQSYDIYIPNRNKSFRWEAKKWDEWFWIDQFFLWYLNIFPIVFIFQFETGHSTLSLSHLNDIVIQSINLANDWDKEERVDVFYVFTRHLSENYYELFWFIFVGRLTCIIRWMLYFDDEIRLLWWQIELVYVYKSLNLRYWVDNYNII